MFLKLTRSNAQPPFICGCNLPFGLVAKAFRGKPFNLVGKVLRVNRFHRFRRGVGVAGVKPRPRLEPQGWGTPERCIGVGRSGYDCTGYRSLRHSPDHPPIRHASHLRKSVRCLTSKGFNMNMPHQ